jgi:hypothetical protein
MSGSNDKPTGLNCPGCGEHAAMALIGGPAFCGNNSCAIFQWDPEQSVNELAPKLHVIDLNRPEGPAGP